MGVMIMAETHCLGQSLEKNESIQIRSNFVHVLK